MPIFTGNPNVVPPPAQFVPPRGTMPVPPWFFPWMYGMPGAEFPRPQAERFGPTPRGLLDQKPDIKPEIDMGRPNPWAAQNVADIYNFPTKRGLLAVPSTEGAGGRGLGSRAQGGLLGSKWRDPRFIQQYEVEQGLPPGSIKQPTAQVKPLPSKLDAIYNKSLAAHEAEIAKRIKARQVGPTSAQMARPVQQTPEISAKLAEARAKRAALIDKAVAAKVPPAKDKLLSFDDWAAKHVGLDYLSRLSNSDLNRLRKTYNTFILREPPK